MKPGGWLLLALIGTLGGACGPGGQGPERPLTVFAAASLADLLGDLSAPSAVPGLPPFEVHHAGSELLLRQVQLGAPADVLVLARAFAPGECPDGVEPRALLATDVVLACAASRPGRPRSWAEFAAAFGAAGPQAPLRLVLADPELAPAGRHARSALQQLGAWDAWRSRLVFAADVRAACSWVALGEADFVLCYRADAESLEGLVTCFGLPGTQLVYEGVVVTPPDQTERAARASAWLAAWRRPELAALARRHHFELP